MKLTLKKCVASQYIVFLMFDKLSYLISLPDFMDMVLFPLHIIILYPLHILSGTISSQSIHIPATSYWDILFILCKLLIPQNGLFSKYWIKCYFFAKEPFLNPQIKLSNTCHSTNYSKY